MQGLGRLVLGDHGDGVVHPHWISRVLTGRLKPCWNKEAEVTDDPTQRTHATQTAERFNDLDCG